MTLKTLGLSFLVFAALIGAAAVFVQMRAAARERDAVAAHPPTGQFIEVGGVRIHAHVEGDGPDLVLIHGSSGNTRDFTFRMVNALKDRYRVIALDRPGLGHSDRLKGDEGLAAQSRVLQAAAAELGAKRPLIVGQSYGGSVGLAWAVHHPDKIAGLVLLGSPSNPWDGSVPALYRVTSHPIGAAVLVPLITAFVPEDRVTEGIASVFEPQDPPEGYGARIGARLALTRKTFRTNAAHRAELFDEILALQPRYGEISIPVEIVHGTADPIVPIEIHSIPLSTQIDGAVLTPLEGVGHMPHHIDPEATLAAIDRAASRAGLR